MKESKTWVWYFVSSFVFLSPFAHGSTDQDFSIQCNQANVTMRFSLEYLENLISSPSHVYLVNVTNPTQLESCRFNKTTTEHTITANSTIFDLCFGITETTAEGIALQYTAQLFPSPRPGQLTSFDSMFRWKFQCLFQDSYNISTRNHILPFAARFKFNSTTANQNFNLFTEFYSDNAFTTPLNPQGSGIQVGDLVHLLISIDGSSNLEISLPECHIRNQQSDIVNVINQGCPADNVTGANITRVSKQAIGLSFPAFLVTPRMDETHQYLTIHCSPLICDSLVASCPDSGCVMRKRRRRAIGKSTLVQAKLHVISNCNLACSEICMYEEQRGYFCFCTRGSVLQNDGLTCLRKGRKPSLSKYKEQHRPNLDKITTEKPKISIKPSSPKTNHHQLKTKHHQQKTKHHQQKTYHHQQKTNNHQQQSNGATMTEENKSRKSGNAVNLTVILLYSTFGMLVLLCFLLLVSVVQKWWIRRKYETLSEVNLKLDEVALAQ